MRAYGEGAAVGDGRAALQLAFMLREQGERAAAKEQARRAAATGDLTAVGVAACWEWDETLDPALEPALRAGADHYPSARAALAQLLVSTSRVEEARQVLEQGVALSEVESMLPLGNLYADLLDDEHAAEATYRSGIAAGDNNCHHNLGILLYDRGDLGGAAEQFELGADAGDALAAAALRDLGDEE
jgi:hypothetical protein